MRYRKRPVEIEAVRVAEVLKAAQHNWADLPPWLASAYERGDIVFLPDAVEVLTLEGRMRGELDDLLILGVKQEIYPCKPDIFEATYEEVAS